MKVVGTAETVGVEEASQRLASIGASVGASDLNDGDVAAAAAADVGDTAAAAATDNGGSFVAAGNIGVVEVDSEVAGYSDEDDVSGRDREQTRDWGSRREKQSIVDICER